jgi:glucose-1-phosphate cytidylyltransferase
VKVAIFAGGKGSRLIEETTVRPKPWSRSAAAAAVAHHAALLGLRASPLRAGARLHGQRDQEIHRRAQPVRRQPAVDFTTREIYGQENSDGDFDVPNPPWVVDLIDTGVETMTGGRLQMLEHYLSDGTFMLTYGDGLSNVDIDKLTAFHKAHGRRRR